MERAPEDLAVILVAQDSVLDLQIIPGPWCYDSCSSRSGLILAIL